MEGQTPRPIDRRFLSRLPAELAAWQRQGLLTPEQAKAILSSYPVAPEAVLTRRFYGKLIPLFAILGSVLVGVGVIVFFASNWQEIPRYGKLALIFVVMAITYGSGYTLSSESRFPRVGGALTFLGALFFGAAIFLVAQVYHMKINDPNLLLWWFLGVLPLAYLSGSTATFTLSLVVGLFALGFRTGVWLDGVDGTAPLFFALYLVLGLLCASLAEIKGRFESTRRYRLPLAFVGLLLTAGTLYLLTFKFPYEMDRRDWEIPWEFLLVFNLAVGASLASALASILVARRQKLAPTLPYLAAALVFLLGASYMVVFLPFDSVAPYAVAFNLIFFAGIVGLIVLGYVDRSPWLINMGLVFFTLDVVTRYFDFGFRLLDRSLFFILGGLLLLGGGFALEQVRRRMLQRLNVAEVVDEEEE